MSLRNGADVLALKELDQKLWVALAMPTREVDIDPATLDFLDADKDGRIRVQDILLAVEWIRGAFQDAGQLLHSSEKVVLEQIKDPKILSAAKRMLVDLGKAEEKAISMSDIEAITKTYANTVLNGDGVIIHASTDDDELKKTIDAIITSHGSVPDRSGKPGVDRAKVDAFFTEIERYATWMKRPEQEPALRPFEGVSSAVGAYQAVAEKLDDYFARCRLAAYDSRAAKPLEGQESDYQAMAGLKLSLAAEEIAKLPLAKIDPTGVLHLGFGLNPAWTDKLAQFAEVTVRPILGVRESLTAADLAKIKERLAPHCDWAAGKPTTAIGSLGEDWIGKLAAGDQRSRLNALIAADAALESDYAERSSVEKLVRLQRDFGRILRNFVNFSDFYSKQDAIFQAGTLYIDARAARLCVWVGDEAKHSVLAVTSGCYLAYCKLTRGDKTQHIAAALTNGDSDNVFVGRNGVFYDRQGDDWDATITKIVSNPISVREAFWSPYKKLIRAIEEQVTKRAQTAESAADAKVIGAGTSIANFDPTKVAPAAAPASATAPPAAAPAPAVPLRKIDIGTVAAIGVAIGGIGTMLAGIFGAVFGLGKWLPLGIGALLLAISGPSMAIAWLKLRKRNLGPLLDANNWAVNGSARINVSFGAAMTGLAELPSGAHRSTSDPFADKPSRWRRWVILGVLLVLGGSWYFGKLDPYLPRAIHSTKVIPWRRPVEPSAPVSTPTGAPLAPVSPPPVAPTAPAAEVTPATAPPAS